jgi:hypothetical protein
VVIPSGLFSVKSFFPSVNCISKKHNDHVFFFKKKLMSNICRSLFLFLVDLSFIVEVLGLKIRTEAFLVLEKVSLAL